MRTLNAASPHVILMVVAWFATHSFEMNRPVVAWPWRGCDSWASGRYEAALLLKQGYYNYGYVFVPDGERRGRMPAGDGSFYEAENEYTILVYYRPAAGRYDRLVGRLTIGGR